MQYTNIDYNKRTIDKPCKSQYLLEAKDADQPSDLTKVLLFMPFVLAGAVVFGQLFNMLGRCF